MRGGCVLLTRRPGNCIDYACTHACFQQNACMTYVDKIRSAMCAQADQALIDAVYAGTRNELMYNRDDSKYCTRRSHHDLDLDLRVAAMRYCAQYLRYSAVDAGVKCWKLSRRIEPNSRQVTNPTIWLFLDVPRYAHTCDLHLVYSYIGISFYDRYSDASSL